MMNKIRLWKLGSLEHKIAPSKKAAEQLRCVLDNIKKDETTDIIWGPDISVIEISDVCSIENYVVTKIDHIGSNEILITARKVDTHESVN
jgi:hypothetical protein